MSKLILDESDAMPINSNVLNENRNPNFSNKEINDAVKKLYHQKPYLTIEQCRKIVHDNIKNGGYLLEDTDDIDIDIISGKDDEEESSLENREEPKDDKINLSKGLSDTMKGIISALVKDEWDAYDGYTSAIATFESEGIDEDAINVLKDIANEELIHVGQLQKLLGIADIEIPKKIEDGSEEATDQLNGEEPKEEEEQTSK